MTTFQTKHRKRDQRLPAVRNELLATIQDKWQGADSIDGLFLGGSLAKNNEDLYSDIDLRIVAQEDRFEEVVRNKRKMMTDLGDVLFFEDMNARAPFTIAHYASFIKVDMFIYTFSHLQPSVWLQGIKILYDPSGKLKDIQMQSETLRYEISKTEVESWQGKVFAYIHEVYRRAMREEYYYALTCLNNLRAFIAQGWYMEADRQPNQAWDWSKIEGARSPLEKWQLSLLGGWMCGRNQEEIMKTLSGMIPEIGRLHEKLCHKAGLEYDRQAFERIVSMVL